MTAIIAWVTARFTSIAPLFNVTVIIAIVITFLGGGILGWTKAAKYYNNAAKVAQLESQLARKSIEYETLVEASAATSKQLADAVVVKSKQDAVIDAYAKSVADAKSKATATGKPVCNETVSEGLLKQMKELQGQAPAKP